VSLGQAVPQSRFFDMNSPAAPPCSAFSTDPCSSTISWKCSCTVRDTISSKPTPLSVNMFCRCPNL